MFGNLDRGGAETSIMTYYRNIDRQRIQFDFVVHGPKRGVFEEEILALGGRIYRVPRLNPFNVVSYIRAWSRILSEHPEFKVVHGHYFTISSVYLLVAKLHRRRIVAHSHNDVPGSAGLVIAVINLWLRHGADLRLACSIDAARYFYGDSAVRKNRVVILKNPIEVGKFAFDGDLRATTRQRLGLADRFVVGHVGRFDPQKNHVFLLDVFLEVLKRDSQAVLLLVGDGKLRCDIERRVLEEGLSDSVIFAGATAEVPALLQAMDVFVFPSLFEGFGVVALEAQASGLPTIVSDSVPSEVLVTDLAEMVPLSASASQWASATMGQALAGPRVSRGDSIMNAGFDGIDNARVLESLYFELGKT